MSLRIITDSASDIEQNEYENVQVIPMTVTIDGVAYKDGTDITKNEFYKKLESSEVIPVSSLISPFEFGEVFETVAADGDEAIVITMSSELSGTYQSATIAAADYDNISVIDSRQVSGAQKILVLRCIELLNLGKTRKEIVEILEQEKKKIVIYAALDSLKYLQKGGRVSKGSALAGGLIGIKPIVTLEDGKLIGIGKVRGSKKSNSFLNEKITQTGGIDYSLPFCVGYSGTDMSNLLQYIDSNKELLNGIPYEEVNMQIGSAVGTHSGPGAVLVSFFSK